MGSNCFNLPIMLDELKVGEIVWEVSKDIDRPVLVAGMNADPACRVSFTLSQILELLGIEELYPCAVLHGIDVEHSAQRKGLGASALRRFEEWARELGCTFAYCAIGYDSDIDGDMEKNINFYKSNGYQIFMHDDGVVVERARKGGYYWCSAFKVL